MITISIISHEQGYLVYRLLKDISDIESCDSVEVILTINVPETLPFSEGDFSFPLLINYSSTAKGFGANHNAAFQQAKGDLFCVLNPDVRINEDPFPRLVNLAKRTGASLVAPAVYSSEGHIEDSIRYFPTLGSIIKKLFLEDHRHYAFTSQSGPFWADWVGGMFMLFESKAFKTVGGFDESFFLYYEDVDICARLWNRGCNVLACPEVRIIHDAQRTSHRSARYLKWHIASLLRYLSKHSGRLPRIPNNDASTAP
jgi:N-acetylglucosaminyl-diphospho-decaprenol L-rhamnosyltransferase